MFFVGHESRPRSFCMKGCLDIVWIEGSQIVGAADAQLEHDQSQVPVRYVLEVPAGWLAAHGFGVGTPVSILLPSS